jgi:hypothetical protein
MTTEEPQTWNARTIIGTVLVRVVVPLWILTGVAAKLVESSPRLLPKKMLDDAAALGIDLNVLLAVIISLEVLAVLVIALLGRVSRVAAAFMLAAFCLVLLREIFAGSTSCGCMGSISPSPWVMLAIDAAMLVGVLAFKPYRFAQMDNRFWPPIAVAGLFVVGTALSFWRVVPMGGTPPPPANDQATSNNGPAAPTGATGPATPDVTTPAGWTPAALPDYFYVSDIDTWTGRAWTEIPLITYLPERPEGLDEGTRYVVFYSRTCEHCQEMFQKDLAPNPGLARQVTAVEIPAKKDKLRGDGYWPMPNNESTPMTLPLGCDWIISPPLTLEIVDGVVQCAKEGDHKECMGLE